MGGPIDVVGASPNIEAALGYGTVGWWISFAGTYSLSALSSGAVIIRVLYGQGLGGNRDGVVRVSIENLMAQLVLMVSAFDFIYAGLWLIWNVAISRKSSVNEECWRRFNYVFTQILMFVSHLMLAAHLYAWVVKRSSPAKLSARFPRRITVLFLFALVIGILMGWAIDKEQDNHNPRCGPHSGAACYSYAVMLVAPLSMVVVCVMYLKSYRTIRGLVHRNLKTPNQHPGLALVSSRIRNRLLTYCLLFVVQWSLDAIFLFLFVFATRVLSPDAHMILQWTWNFNAGLAGFFDALVMGWRDVTPGRLASQPTHSSDSEQPQQDGQQQQQQQQQQHALSEGSYRATAMLSDMTASGSRRSSGVAWRKQETARPTAQEIAKSRPHVSRHIYASTYNMGGAGALDPEQVAAWIPLDYDVYALGMQECERLPEVIAAVHQRLGGSTAYKQFSTDIGDATILHGKIALVVFARLRDVATGAFKRIGNLQGRMHNGLNLGITRAANKGMVGLSFRYHDQSIAFVNCHFTADKKGRSGTFKRVKDAVKTLQELVLVSEEVEHDCHLQLHHVVVVGDMNFRIQETPDWVLQEVGQSIQWEAEEFQRKHPRVAARGKGWRDLRQACFRLTEGAKRRQRLEEEEEEEEEGEQQPQQQPPVTAATANGNGGSASAASTDGGGPTNGQQEQEQQNGDAAVAHQHDEDEAALAEKAEKEWEEEMVAMEEEAVAAAGLEEEPAPTPVTGDEESMVHDAEVKRAQAKNRLLKSARVWDWLGEMEELSMQMREGHVFYGFREQLIRFPPSFKLFPRRDAAGFTDPSILPSLYKVSVKEGKKTGLRPPSYTDRVLVHSLPDEAPRLRARAYDVLERVAASDHRPVSLALELLVQREVIGFERRDRAYLRGPEAAGVSTASPAAAAATATTTTTGGNGTGDKAPTEDDEAEAFFEASVCLCDVAMSRLRADVAKDGAIKEVRICYPLIAEDPLATQRKVVRLHDFITADASRHFGSRPAVPVAMGGPTSAFSAVGGPSQLPGQQGRSTRSMWRAASAGSGIASGVFGGLRSMVGAPSMAPSASVAPGGVPGLDGTLRVGPQLNDPSLLKSLHCFRWSEATKSTGGGGSGGGIGISLSGSGGRSHHEHEAARVRFATLASLEYSTHMLVKLVDGAGRDLGQGVICLRPLIRKVATRNKELFASYLGCTPAGSPVPPEHPPGVGGGVGVGVGGGEEGPGGGGDLEAGRRASWDPAMRDEVETMRIDLSRGGEYLGTLTFDISLHLSGLNPTQLRLVARESTMAPQDHSYALTGSPTS